MAQLSEKFKAFVTRLHSAVRSERPSEDYIHALYQDSEDIAKEFNSDPWPPAEVVSTLVNGDKIFLLIYTEMAFQAFFKNKNVKATMVDRVGSWENYTALFTYLIEDKDGMTMTEAAKVQGAEMTITGKWAFDIIYEFVYQFQEACQYRASAIQSASSEQELQQVLSQRDVWAVDKVFNYLHLLAKVSKVREVLEAAKRPECGGGPPVSYPSKMHYLLGYFALVGLNRLECLLGDFQGALAVAEPVMGQSLAGAGLLLSSSLIAQVSLYYHIGLSYLMIRRYKEAIGTFVLILDRHLKYKEAIGTFVLILDGYFKYLDTMKQQRQAQGLEKGQKGAEFDMAAAKLVDKVATMLLIVQHLCPGHNIPENIRGHLMGEKMKDKMRAVQSGDVEAILNLFILSAPKFISPATDYEEMLNRGGRPSTYGGLQRAIFREEVRQMLELRKLRGYLKLYSTIGLAKLSGFTGEDPEEICRQLIQYKHKLLQLGSSSGSSALDFHYYLDGDMVHVDEAERESRQEVTKQFQSQIKKFEELARVLRR